jgi:hypothetical protein
VYYQFPLVVTEKSEVSCGQTVPQWEILVMERVSRGAAWAERMLSAATANLLYE